MMEEITPVSEAQREMDECRLNSLIPWAVRQSEAVRDFKRIRAEAERDQMSRLRSDRVLKPLMRDIATLEASDN